MLSNCTPSGGCATSFPANVGWSATFDRELMRSMATVVGEETRAAFNLKYSDNAIQGLGPICWGPVLNMNRDPRWCAPQPPRPSSLRQRVGAHLRVNLLLAQGPQR